MRGGTYFENLDGLRFFCFLSVFFYHSFDSRFDYIREDELHFFVRHFLFENANLGVNFFFVLSGFLITYLLIEERKFNGYIDLPRFWTRRILRIWPLFYLSVLFGFVVFPVLKYSFGQVSTETASIWYYLTFLNNFDVIAKGIPDASVLGALWSVAVEEQFYLVWPVVLLIFPVRQYWIPFAGIIAASLVFRMFNDSPVLYHFHTLSCIGDMAIGAFGAWSIAQYSRVKTVIAHLASWQVIMLYILFACVFLFRDQLFGGPFVLRIFERIIIAVIMLLIILEQCYSQNSFFKLSRFKTVSFLGTMTYGLYCFHFIGILIAKTVMNTLGFNTHVWQVLFVETGLALIVTIFISRLSYLYFETPFLKLKERFSFLARRPVATIGNRPISQQGD